MKKACLMYLAMLMFLMFPITSYATVIPYETMTLSASDPIGNVTLSDWTGNVYLDYELTSVLLDSNEVFCVEDANGLLGNSVYTLISLDEIDDNLRDKYQAAANIAEVYYDDTEANKAAAQIAIWETIFDWGNGIDLDDDTFEFNYSNLVSSALVNSIIASSFDDTNNWWLAISPASEDGSFAEGEIGQNYLVRMAAPVPEPATILLLGTGLLGAAGAARRKRKK